MTIEGALLKEAIMTGGKYAFAIAFIPTVVALSSSPLLAASHEGHQHPMKAGEGASAVSGTGQAADFVAMPGPGKKVPLGNGSYLIYAFDKKPKMGTVILKVEAYASDGKRDTSLEILGDSGMPSMRGAHETGDQPFKLSKKGDYLLPVNIVMPGDWEIRLTVKKDGKVIFRGSYKFDV
jgi:hypothetical protein